MDSTGPQSTPEPEAVPARRRAAPRGFGILLCPMCHETQVISVDLNDVSTFNCPDCGDDFGRADIERMRVQLDDWQRVFDWLDTAPEAP